jgi:hypothetical protein
VSGTGFAEFCQDDGAGDAVVRGDRECVARVVVEPVEDLHCFREGRCGSRFT